jgi:chemotaxis protein MotD
LASLAEATQSNTVVTLDEPVARPQTHERVAVTSTQSFPAPVTPGLDPTTSRLATAIASDMGAQQTPSTATLTPATPQQAPVAAHTLKIELHPAELGMVNAHLRLAGEQLSIELLPDTQEAYRRLSSDGDTIARALRDLGFDVGKITVLQPSIAATPAPRTDTGGSTTALPNRDSSSFQSGQSGSNGNGSGEHHSGRSNDNDAHNSDRPASIARGRTDSGLVI